MFPPDPRMMQEEPKAGRLHWVTLVVVLAGFALLILFAIVPGVRMKKYDGDFERIRKGWTVEQVTEVMGEADTSRDALPDLERYWGQDVQLHVKPEHIETVLSWEVRFFFKKFIYQVGLDARGKAIAKTRFKR